MLVAEVLGRVWNDRQIGALEGRRLVVTRELGGEGALVAVDLVDVAAGDTVLVATDEAAASAAGAAGIDAAVVARVRGADVLPGRAAADSAEARA
jgi:microcompartment protein CcmK/EutM